MSSLVKLNKARGFTSSIIKDEFQSRKGATSKKNQISIQNGFIKFTLLIGFTITQSYSIVGFFAHFREGIASWKCATIRICRESEFPPTEELNGFAP